MYSDYFKKNIVKVTILFVFFIGGLSLISSLNAYGEEIDTNNQKAEYKESKMVNGKAVMFFHPTQGGTISSAFGERWGKFHKGIDIPKNMDTSVIACLDGKVKNVFYEAEGYGKIVILDHGNGLESRYAHLNSYNVKIGDTVKAGEKIANVGTTGRSTGPHLHFEIRLNDEPINPQKYI
ncbi:M23 family metallopeptidase [uncultured Clostridium sp.]|uniref:M23 family metallopeptidase n=1 Tax=uncultured Clostridium sp. TaxID=59620 RepID=UPI00261E5D68|nr:M23 family metallopeptidase [uncultured Clostridium sp.]